MNRIPIIWYRYCQYHQYFIDTFDIANMICLILPISDGTKPRLIYDFVINECNPYNTIQILPISPIFYRFVWYCQYDMSDITNFWCHKASTDIDANYKILSMVTSYFIIICCYAVFTLSFYSSIIFYQS